MSQTDEEEKDHWFNVLRTFLFYEEFVAFDLGRRQEHINRMPAKYADRLPDSTFEKFSALHHAAEGNQDFFRDMVHFHVTDSFHAPSGSNAKPIMPTKAGVPIELGQQHRNNAVLHSLVREWSEAGAKERETTFQVKGVRTASKVDLSSCSMLNSLFLLGTSGRVEVATAGDCGERVQAKGTGIHMFRSTPFSGQHNTTLI